jgi:hypothetical protein
MVFRAVTVVVLDHKRCKGQAYRGVRNAMA